MDIELAQALAENELLKSLLYYTKRSCNNCGKITCENFQRQRKDCCENWVSYKDYIKELEAQIEKMKCCENCGWYYLQQHWRESKEINESRMFHCGTCGNKRNWKIKEIKEK